jgi:Fur family peroxide stress response transcriptional regulator
MTSAQALINRLRQAGYRITPQRWAICTYLATSEQHPTAYQVYTDLVAQNPTISRATVYNTLNILRELGTLALIDLGDDHTHYETNLAPHLNLICQRCQRIVDQPATGLTPVLQTLLKQAGGFAPTTIQIQMLGLCVACQERSSSA